MSASETRVAEDVERQWLDALDDAIRDAFAEPLIEPVEGEDEQVVRAMARARIVENPRATKHLIGIQRAAGKVLADALEAAQADLAQIATLANQPGKEPVQAVEALTDALETAQAEAREKDETIARLEAWIRSWAANTDCDCAEPDALCIHCSARIELAEQGDEG